MAQKRYDEAETTLVTGMEALLTHHQTVPASELGQQLIKLYVDTHKSPTDATIGSLAFLPSSCALRSHRQRCLDVSCTETIVRHFHGYGPDVDDGRVSFMKAAIK